MELYNIIPPPPQEEEKKDIVPPPPGVGELKPLQPLQPSGAVQASTYPGAMAPPMSEEMIRANRLYEKRMAPEVERDLYGEIAASVGRGAINLAKLPIQIAKMAGDVVGSKTIEGLTVPTIEKMEEYATSPALKPGKAAGGTPIELDRIIQDPMGVVKQIGTNVTNPNFWAAQLPEAAMSTIPYFFGSWMPRVAATTWKYGKALEAANAAGKTGEALAIAKKIERIGKIGGYGMAMAMEGASAEQNLRQWEEDTGKKVDWFHKNAVQILGGVAAGTLEALSLERIFSGKNGMTFIRKVLDSIATEGSTEGAQEFVANAFQKWGYDPDAKLTQNVVESILVGAALGGLMGGAERTGQYLRHIREVNKKAQDEKTEPITPAIPQEITPWEEGGRYNIIPGVVPTAPAPTPLPPAFTPGAPVEPMPGAGYEGIVPTWSPTQGQFGAPPPERITTPAPEGGSALVDQFGRPIYPTATELARQKQPFERNALEKWLVDQVGKEGLPGVPEITAPTEEDLKSYGSTPPWLNRLTKRDVQEPGVRGYPEPMGDVSSTTDEIMAGNKPSFAPEGASTREIMTQYIHLFGETGDPRVGGELTRLIINNPQLADELLTPAEPEIERVRPIAQTIRDLTEKVDAGDPNAARQLHDFLSSNIETIRGVTPGQMERALPIPIDSGTQIQLADGRIVTLAEDRAPYDVKPVRIIDTEGNTVEIPMSEIRGLVDREGRIKSITQAVREQIAAHQETLPELPREPEWQTRLAEIDAYQGGTFSPQARGMYQDLGQTVVPGLRLGDAEQTGRLFELFQKGEASQAEWNTYVEDLYNSGKVYLDNTGPIENVIGYAPETAPVPTGATPEGGVLPGGITYNIEQPTPMERKKPEWDLGKAVEKYDRQTIIKAYGKFNSRSEILKNFTPEERRLLFPYMRREAQGPDALLSELKGVYPDMFGEFDTDADLLRGIIDGRLKPQLDTWEEYINDQIAKSDLEEAEIAEIERLAQAEIDAERTAIEGEHEGGTEWDLTAPSGPGPAKIETRLEEVLKVHPDLDPEKAKKVLMAFPDKELIPDYVAHMVNDQDLFNAVARGNLSAKEREQLYKNVKDYTQGVLGVPPAGGLFESEKPAPERLFDLHKETLEAKFPARDGNASFFTEAAGDVFREMTKSSPDEYYIREKLNRLDKILDMNEADINQSKQAFGEYQGDFHMAAIDYINKADRLLAEINKERGSLGENKWKILTDSAMMLSGLGHWATRPSLEATQNLRGRIESLKKGIDEYFQTGAPTEIDTLRLAREFSPTLRNLIEKQGPSLKPNDLIRITKEYYDIDNLEPHRKKIEEAFELSLVREASRIANIEPDPVKALDKLTTLYNAQPTLTSRTSTTVRNQAYSTPAPLAYLMSKWAGVTKESWVYEPTAGNGMLLIGTNPEQTFANELDSIRAKHLADQGYTIGKEDASALVGKEEGVPENSMDVVLANPPFGKLDAPVDFEGYKIQKKEHLISLDALKAMDDDGKAALILGGHVFETPYGQAMENLTEADRVFFNYLYSHYNVTHHVNVDGKIYARMGTSFPIQLITIEGRKATPEGVAPFEKGQIEVAKTFNDVYDLLKGEIYGRQGLVAPEVSPQQPERPSGVGRPGAETTGAEGTAEAGGIPPILGGQGGEVAPEKGEGATGGGQPRPGKPGAAGGVNVRPPRPGQPPVSVEGAPQPQPQPHPPTGVSPQPRPEAEGQPPGGVPGGGEPTPTPEPGTKGAGRPGVPGPTPKPVTGKKPVTSGTKITLPDGRVVTLSLEEERAPYRLGLPTTEDFNRAGFITKQGELIDVGPMQHRATLADSGLYPNVNTDDLIPTFMRDTGAIRTTLQHGDANIEIGAKPTSAQLSQLKDFMQYAKKISIDIVNRETGGANWQGTDVREAIKFINNAIYARPTILTLEEEKPAEPTVRVRDADGNILEIPMSELVGGTLEDGSQITAETEFRAFKKGQWVVTDDGLEGQITKIRGAFDKMQITVQGKYQAGEEVATVTLKPDNIIDFLPEPTEAPPTEAEGAPPTEETGPIEATAPPDVPEPEKIPESNLQVFYEPVSKAPGLRTMAPRYMAEATRNFLVNLQDRIGPIDNFVQKEMRYATKEELYKALGAEQIEGVAMAITSIKQTGLNWVESWDPMWHWRTVDSIPNYRVISLPNTTDTNWITPDKYMIEMQVGDRWVRDNTPYKEAEDAKEAVEHMMQEFMPAPTGSFIIGHQTGVGKGRMVASMMDWAKAQGYTPIFMTADPKLFSDMYRDFRGINRTINPLLIASDRHRAKIYDDEGNVLRKLDLGAISKALRQGSLPGEFDSIFTTYFQFGSQKMTPKKQFLQGLKNAFFILDESHLASGDSYIGAFLRDNVLPNSQGAIFSSATFAKRPDTMILYLSRLASDLNIDTDHLIDNIQRGGLPLQEWIAREWAKNGLMVRNELSFIKENEWNVLNDKDEIVQTFTTQKEADEFAAKNGGKVEPGKIEMPLEMDTKNKERDRQRSDDLTHCLRGILAFSKKFSEYVRRVLRPQYIQQGIAVHGKNFQGDLKNTNFASVMHNAVAQMQYCLRVDTTVEEALKILERDEKPVIGVYNTMESFMDFMVDTGEAVEGQPVDMRFDSVLNKSLEGSLYLKMKDAQGRPLPKIKVRVETLPPDIQQLYTQARDSIKELVTDVPALPIDAIKRAIESKVNPRTGENYKIGEITGRQFKLEYRTPEKLEPGVRVEIDSSKVHPTEVLKEALEESNYKGRITAVEESGSFTVDLDSGLTGYSFSPESLTPMTEGYLVKRSGKERNDKNTPVIGFNGGDLDGLIVNSAASTGLSLHSSSEFKDQRVRNTLLTQLAYNIDTVVQLLGRTNRTGQVNYPRFKTLVSTLPSEKRPLVLFQKKLASLMAQVTAKGEAAMSLKIPDVVNHIGDYVTAEMFAESPDLATQLGVLEDIVSRPKFISADIEHRVEQILAAYPGAGDLTKKVSGYVAIQNVDSQEEFWNGLDTRFEERVEYLKQIGEYNLQTEMIDLEARTLDKSTLTQGTPGRTALTDSTYFETVQAKVQRKPLKSKEIQERINRALGLDQSSELGKDTEALAKAKATDIGNQIEEDFEKWIREKRALMARSNSEAVINNFVQRATRAKDLTLRQIQRLTIGNHVGITTAMDVMEGIIYDVRYKPSEGSNPGTPSNVRLMIAVNSTIRNWQTSLAGAGTITNWEVGPGAEKRFGIPEDWDDRLPLDNYETRYLVTGNLLGNTVDAGHIVHFTREDGSMDMGFLMPMNFQPGNFANLHRVFISQKQATDYFLKKPDATLSAIESPQNIVFLKNVSPGKWQMDVSEAKKTGGKFYLDKDILQSVANNEFYSVRGYFRADISGPDALQNVLDVLYKKHRIMFSMDQATFDGFFGGRTQTLQISEPGPTPFKVKTTATLGRQIVPNPEALKMAQAEESRVAYGSEKQAEKVVRETAAKARAAVRLQVSRDPAGQYSLRNYQNKIAQEYADKGWISYIGRRLTPGMEPYEIAEMFQIFRAPNQENFHLIYTDTQGNIVGHNMLSSGTLRDINIDVGWLMNRINDSMRRNGATQVHFLHNHPSGDSTMSDGDKMAFKLLREGWTEHNIKGLGNKVGQFMVIDHGKFNYLYNGMEYQGYFKPLPGAGDWLDKRVRVDDAGDLIRIGAELKYDKATKAALVFTDTKGMVNGITIVNNRVLTKPITKVRETFNQMMKSFNAAEVSIIVGNLDVMETYLINQATEMNKGAPSFDEFVRDIQTDMGHSIRLEMPELWAKKEGKPLITKYTKGFLAETLAPYEATPETQETINTYRENYVAPKPEVKKPIKERITDFLHTFYDQTVDRWASWERRAARAIHEGVIVPAGEVITNTISYLRGTEGRIRQGIVGDYVYQDAKAFDETLGMDVFTGDELVRRGPSLKVRLEPLGDLAAERGMTNVEARNDLETFMVAQRDLELAGDTGVRTPGEIKGVHPNESNAVIKAIQTKYGKDFKRLSDIADSIREWGDQMILQPLLQVGFISEELYYQIKEKNQYYIPYKRLLDDIETYIAAHAGSAGVPGRVIREIKGSEKKVLAPLEMWIDLAAKAQYAFAKNKVLRSAWVTAQYAGWQDVKEIQARYLPFDFKQKQEIDKKLRPQLVQLAKDLGIEVKVMRSLGRGILGQFKAWLKQEVTAGVLTGELAKEIHVRFATYEGTLSHELGHGIDHAHNLQKLLITDTNESIRKEIRAVADMRLGDNPSQTYRKYVRKKSEQMAEFVNRYIIDRASVERLAPNALKIFEAYLNATPQLKPLLQFRLSAQAGMMDFWNRAWYRDPRSPDPLALPYFRDGKQRWLKLPPDMFQATQNAMPSEMSILMRIARWPADTLRTGAILVPEFAIGRNPARDIIQSWLFSRFGFSPLKWVRDAVGLMTKDEKTMEYRRQWEAGGGPLAALATALVEPDKITPESVMGDPNKFKYFPHPLDALRYASAYLENLTRFSIYKQAREKGLSHADAIFEARRTTLDYARAGAHPAVRFLNTIIPFWNANIQGMDKLVHELRGPNKWAVYRRLSMLAGASVLIWLYAHQDDRYKELEDWEKNYFWHIPLGPKSPIIRIPKPFEAGILFGSFFERMAEWANGENINGVQSALKAAWDAATPEVIPAIARPYLEGWSNYDFFRSRPIEDAALQNLPVQLRYKPWTTSLAKTAAPLIGISPVKFEHFIRAWSGGLGANYILPGTDVVLRKAGILEDIPQPTQDLMQKWGFGVRSFFTKNPTGYRAKSVNDFFEQYQAVMQADAGWKALWKSGQTEQLDKFLAARPEAMFARVARKYMDEMTKIKAERTVIHLSKTLTSDEKRQKLDALDERIVQIARHGREFMNQDVADKVKMPPRMGMDPKQYYNFVAGSTDNIFKYVNEYPKVLEDKDRLAALLKRGRAEYVPKKTREERRVEAMFGFPNLASSFGKLPRLGF